MKVSDLIAKLQQVAPDMIVYVRAWVEPCDGCNIQVVSCADDVWIYHGEYDDQLYIGQANEGTEMI